MDPAENITLVYEELKASLTEKLGVQGYLPVHEGVNDKVFGSRYMIWSDNREAIRLTWDGKEAVFLLELAQSLPLSGVTPWTLIIEAPFDEKNKGLDYAAGVVQQILNSLDSSADI